MKRILFLIVVIFIWSQMICGQIVPSSCTAHDSIISKYRDDADRLALRRIYRNSLTYMDSASIPQTYSDTVIDALIAVYNAASLPASDTVTAMLNIHSFPDYEMKMFVVRADSNLFWMQELQNGNLTTGNATIDNAITNYGLTINSYYSSLFSPDAQVVFKTDSNYNLLTITNQLDTITGVLYSELDSWIGDGNNIWDSVHYDHVELTYSLGWGDCMSGCMSRRFWKFNVYFDCSVEFVESYGAPLQFTGIENNNDSSITIFPNPFENVINLSGINSVFDYSIYNVTGEIIFEGKNIKGSIYGLENLPSGYFVLQIKTNKLYKSYQLIKK